MTATNNLTNITRAESGDSARWVDSGGGQGSQQSGDLPIDGLEARGRRIDGNQRGFAFNAAASIDISAAGTHVGFWTAVLQSGLIGALGLEHGFSDSAANHRSGNWDAHRFPAANFPVDRKYMRVWVDVSRTRESGSGTLNLAAVSTFGCQFDMGNVGGTSLNCQLDRIDYGTGGVTITGGSSGTPETFASGISLSNSNSLGVVNANELNAPVKVGGAATVFRDENFSIKAGDQPLAANDWVRIDWDASDGAEDILLGFGFLEGVHFTFAGTSAVQADLGSLILSGAPLAITMTAAWSWGGSLINSPTLTQGGANLDGLSVDSSTSTTAVIRSATGSYIGGAVKNCDRGMDVTALIDGSDEVSINGTQFSGNTIDITLSHATDVTINPSGGALITTAENTGAGNVTISTNNILTLAGIPSGARVTVCNSSTRNVLKDTVSTGADITYTHGGGETVDILLIDGDIDPNLSDVYDLTLPASDSTIDFRTFTDINYENP